MKFFVTTLGVVLSFLVSFALSPPEAMPKPTIRAIPPPERLAKPLIGDVVHTLLLAYDPYDDCVGPWQTVWPRKTAGGGNPETMGLGADPSIFSYGTKVRFRDPDICKFIRDTNARNTSCTLTVDDTGSAAKDDTARRIYHLELRVPRRTPGENAHARAMRFGRHVDTEIEIVSLPRSR